MQVLTPNFSLGEEDEADPAKVHPRDLCLTLKITLQKSSRMYNCNITLFVTAFIYTNVPTCSVTHLI
jgi:hypothetical protein